MSDKFEQWFDSEINKATALKDFDWIHSVILNKHRYLSGWSAALSSLQGEAVVKSKPLEWEENRLGNILFNTTFAMVIVHDEDTDEYIAKYDEDIEEIFDSADDAKQWLQDRADLITSGYTADYAAKIAELEAKLAEVEKDAERWNLHVKLASQKLGVQEEDLIKEIDIYIDEAIDAAIQESKKGGATMTLSHAVADVACQIYDRKFGGE